MESKKHTDLLHLPLIALVGAGHVVGQRLRAREVVVGAGRGDDVALAGDLPGEAGDGAGDLVDLAEEDHAGEASAMRGVRGRVYVRERDREKNVRRRIYQMLLLPVEKNGSRREGSLRKGEREKTYALGYEGMVGWKTKILMGLSAPSTIVVTSAWVSLINMVRWSCCFLVGVCFSPE